ncbi:MAG: hypothetical protein IOC94_18250, partial [Methylocystis sp.]|nr:hypothetical protein [Methylocystis sp.]
RLMSFPSRFRLGFTLGPFPLAPPLRQFMLLGGFEKATAHRDLAVMVDRGHSAGFSLNNARREQVRNATILAC